MKKYMMATQAIHQLGDISRDTPDLCFVNETLYENTFYVGAWVEGFGFFNVFFPKYSTRELTPEEILKYQGTPLAINNQLIGQIDILGKV